MCHDDQKQSKAGELLEGLQALMIIFAFLAFLLLAVIAAGAVLYFIGWGLWKLLVMLWKHITKKPNKDGPKMLPPPPPKIFEKSC